MLSKLYIAESQMFSLALLTSDGVHEYVDLDAMESVIAGEEPLEAKCEKIIRLAVDAGSEDDLSVVIICPTEN